MKGDRITDFGSLPDPPKGPREASLVDALVRELEANGWKCWREVHFIAPTFMGRGYNDSKKRDIDIYARKVQATEHGLGIGFCLSIEAKFQPGLQDLRCVEQQVISAICGHDWHTHKEHFRRPDAVVMASERTLTRGWGSRSQDGCPWQEVAERAELGALDRRLWASGGAILWRYGNDGLGFTMHVGRQARGVRVTK
jgi:hypothetical protein